jgi:hypothetical protein
MFKATEAARVALGGDDFAGVDAKVVQKQPNEQTAS